MCTAKELVHGASCEKVNRLRVIQLTGPVQVRPLAMAGWLEDGPGSAGAPRLPAFSAHNQNLSVTFDGLAAGFDEAMSQF